MAAAAIYFTAGAVLALPGASIGLGGAVNAVTAGLGQGVVGGVVRGALTAAAKGAAIGGITSAATGGSFSQGAKGGAIVGAVTGGISGGFNAAKAAIPPGGGNVAGTGAKTFPLPETPAITGQFIDAAGKVVGDGTKKGLFQAGGWLERNQDLVGNVVKGVGTGLLSGGEADAVGERFRLTAANYAGTDPGRNYRDLAPGTSGQPSGPAPSGQPVAAQPVAAQPGAPPVTERYDPRNFGSFEYQYSPEQGRIIKVPVDGAV